jgi:hypothetical protein
MGNKNKKKILFNIPSGHIEKWGKHISVMYSYFLKKQHLKWSGFTMRTL